MAKIRANEQCPCGSGKKYKKCCINNIEKANIFNNLVALIVKGHIVEAASQWKVFREGLSLRENEEIGLAAYFKKHYQLSEKIFEYSVLKKSQNALVIYYLGFLQGSRYEYKEALKNISRAFHINNKSCTILAGYALILQKTNRNIEAKNILDDALKKGCESLEIKAALLLVYIKLAMHKQLIKLIDDNPNLIRSPQERKLLIARSLLANKNYSGVLDFIDSNLDEIFFTKLNSLLVVTSCLELYGFESGIEKLYGYRKKYSIEHLEFSIAEYLTTNGMYDLAEEFRSKWVVKEQVNESQLLDNLLFPSLRVGKLSESDIFRLHKKITYTYTLDATNANITLQKRKKIRVGFVSPDMRGHSVAHFIAPIFRHYNKDIFEFYVYFTDVDKWDVVTESLVNLVDVWRSFPTGDSISRAVKQDNIDILFDLAGHTSNNSLREFAKRMAPVQVSWIGYPFSTGCPNMDYWIGDPCTLAKDDKAYFTERLICLPEVFSTYEPLGIENVKIVKHRPEEIVTFGSFNSWDKITNNVLMTWIKILKVCPSSRLVIKAKQLENKNLRDSISKIFEQNSIEKRRVDLLGHLKNKKDHLMLYNSIDIALDAFPYNGTTTTCEALWMGLPVLAKKGNSHRSRVTESFLKSINREEWIGQDEMEYIGIAKRLAGEILSGKHSPSDLRKDLKTSPLFNARLFIQGFEEMLVKIHEEKLLNQTL